MKNITITSKPGTDTKKQPITIEALYPNLTVEEQAEAAYYLSRYLEVIKGIFERTKNLTK